MEVVLSRAEDLPESLSSEVKALKLSAIACAETMTGFNLENASSSGTVILGVGVASLRSQADALHMKIEDLYPNIQENAESVAGMKDALNVTMRMRMHLRHVERPGREAEEEGPEVSNEQFRALATRRADKGWQEKLDKYPTMMPMRPELSDRRPGYSTERWCTGGRLSKQLGEEDVWEESEWTSNGAKRRAIANPQEHSLA